MHLGRSLRFGIVLIPSSATAPANGITAADLLYYERGWSTMNIDFLREFTELAKRLNYTETARFLNMSQPTLSKHMNQFERELKFTLFEREGNSMRQTNAGAALLPYAYQVTDADNDLNEKILELRKSPPPRLSISGLTDEGPSTEVLGYLISLLKEKHGANFLEVKSRFNRDLREMLGSKEVDLVFDPVPKDEIGRESYLEMTQIAELRLIALMDKNNPLAQTGSVSLAELKKTPFLKYEGIYLSRSWGYIEQACQDHGFTPRTRSCHCANMLDLFAKCTNLGPEVIIIGCHCADRVPSSIRAFCKVVDLTDDNASIPLYLVYRKDNENPLLKEILEVLHSTDGPPLKFTL